MSASAADQPRPRPARALAAALGLGVTICAVGEVRAQAPADTSTVAYVASGVRVLQHTTRGTGLVAVRLYLLGGARQITPATAGIEPLLLEASAYGTAAFPGAEALRAMARTGSDVSIEAEPDWTVFGFVGLSREFGTSWSVFADRLAHPTLSAEAVERARSRVLAGIQARYASPDHRIWQMAFRARFPGHPYVNDPAGTTFSVPDITAEQLKAYLAEQVVKSRLLLVVVGDVERAEVEAQVAATLGTLPAGNYSWTLPPPAPPREPRWLVERDSLPTNYILGYFAGPSPRSRDYPAFVVATYILSGMVNSAVREQRSLSYASFAPVLERGTAVGGVYASTSDPDEVVRIMTQLMAVLARFQADPGRFSAWVERVQADEIHEGAAVEEQADRLARAELYYGDWRRAGPNMRRLKGVSPREVAEAVDRYLRNVSYAYIGDPRRITLTHAR
jgi:zinc protease